MNKSNAARHQGLLINSLATGHGLVTRICDDMLELVHTYSALSETGYVQLPFLLERPHGQPSPHFWVSLAHGGQTIALAGYRLMTNGDKAQTCAAFFADGGLYPPQNPRPEAYLLNSGPMLAPHVSFGYLGAGWVDPQWRGHNLAGYLSRIVYGEAALRSKTPHALMSAMTFEPMFRSGMNTRASGWHHMHAQLILDGYLSAMDRDERMYLSYNTMAEQAALYDLELHHLDQGQPVPWLRRNDKTPTSAILANVMAALS